jgi:hypothetical protein
VAEGITRTLETIVSTYKATVAFGQKPVLPDYGVPEHDVFLRVEAEDFAAFYEQVQGGAQLARNALDATTLSESRRLWRQLLGSKFPAPTTEVAAAPGGFAEPERPARPAGTRFA